MYAHMTYNSIVVLGVVVVWGRAKQLSEAAPEPKSRARSPNSPKTKNSQLPVSFSLKPTKLGAATSNEQLGTLKPKNKN